jgi:hypothetical protein
VLFYGWVLLQSKAARGAATIYDQSNLMILINLASDVSLISLCNGTGILISDAN